LTTLRDKILAIGTLLVVFGLLWLAFSPRYGLVGLKTAGKAFIDSHGQARCSRSAASASSKHPLIPIYLAEASGLLKQQFATKTFSVAVADINNDDEDDILIGAHETPPHLLINNGTGFERSLNALFKPDFISDRHGYTLADLDNDGDLDIAVAGGGSDGVGSGAPNFILRNDSSPATLKFTRETLSREITMKPGRGRSMLPVVSADGRAVDLYYTALSRDNFNNVLLQNQRNPQRLSFDKNPRFPFSGDFNDRGRGTFADFDKDGHSDYLVVSGGQAKIIWSPESNRGETLLADSVISVAVADFNNDGAMDVYAGRGSRDSNSDNVTHDNERIIFRIARHLSAGPRAISFRTTGTALTVNLKQHIPAPERARLSEPPNIFIGESLFSPKTKIFTVSQAEALGKPAKIASPGTYIWYSADTGRWHVEWRQHPSIRFYKGSFGSSGIEDLRSEGLQQIKTEPLRDWVLINANEGVFTRQCSESLEHSLQTASVTIADFNHDGWLDVVGIRQAEQGRANGYVFVLSNSQGQAFTLQKLPGRDIDRLSRSDSIAHGFFNADNRPDVIATNGFGQLPGSLGYPRILLNGTEEAPPALRVLLEGDESNHFGLGAAITLTSDKGVILGHRVVGLNYNVTQDTYWQHFGLGQSPPPYALRVDWPDGSATHHTLPGPGKFTIKQQQSLPVSG
jgi:hypothetical protein